MQHIVLKYALVFLKVFKEWNKGELDSFLIEITADIMAFKDKDGAPLVEKIRDSAGQVSVCVCGCVCVCGVCVWVWVGVGGCCGCESV